MAVDRALPHDAKGRIAPGQEGIGWPGRGTST